MHACRGGGGGGGRGEGGVSQRETRGQGSRPSKEAAAGRERSARGPSLWRPRRLPPRRSSHRAVASLTCEGTASFKGPTKHREQKTPLFVHKASDKSTFYFISGLSRLLVARPQYFMTSRRWKNHLG